MTIISCIMYFSIINGIDPALTKAVIQVESNWNTKAVNEDKDFGLMQVREKYVKENKKQLMNPCTNVKVGTDILRNAKENCKHKEDNTWVICFNVGVTGGNKIKHPKLFPYYKKVMKAYNETKSVAYLQKHVPVLFREVPFTLHREN